MAPTTTTITQPSCIIDPTLAKERIALFNEKKKPVLDTLIGYKTEIDRITYSVPVFLEFLEFLTKVPGKYSGVRVYFASYRWDQNDPCSRYIPSGFEDNLTLVLVPTISFVQNGGTIEQDDLNNCFVIAHSQLIHLPKPGAGDPCGDTASNWVKHYREKLPALKLDGVQVSSNPAFKDTKSLWYKIGIFIDDGDNPGLISFIKELQRAADPLVAVVARLACYTESDHSKSLDAPINDKPLNYQLSLLFELQQQSSQATLRDSLTAQAPPALGKCFGTKYHADELARAAVAHANAPQPASPVENAARVAAVAPAGATATLTATQSSDADTGFPCPPGICSGSLLPVS